MKDNNFDTELDKIIRASMELKDEPAPELDKKLKAAVYRQEVALKKQSSTRDIPLWYLPMILNLVTFSMLGLAAFMLISNMYLSCIAAGVSGVRWERRTYRSGDLAGAFLAVAATDDRAVNRQVGEEARALGIPVSVADCREECSFFFPAVCEGGGVTAGLVSRGGRDHGRTARAARADLGNPPLVV